MSEQTRQLAERIARDLFTNGAGHHALRLDLFIGEGRHFGGWSEVGLANRVEKFLAEAAGASVPQEAAVTRFEVIDHRTPCGKTGVETGRVYGAYGCRIVLSYQDGGRTLKVFIDGKRSSACLTGEASSAPQGER